MVSSQRLLPQRIVQEKSLVNRLFEPLSVHYFEKETEMDEFFVTVNDSDHVSAPLKQLK